MNERFHEDWSHDHAWGWQQNRAVVGHNLKIAWNLMRINSVRPSERYVELARKIARGDAAVGADRQRGGWYDVMEREKEDGQEWYRYVWHDRKAWWQQEQAILAYLILAGILGDDEYVPRRGMRRRSTTQVPRPRCRQRLLQRARERSPVPARERAAEGQPLDVGLPLDGALLPGGDVHEPADHEAAARPALQAEGGRLPRPDPPRGARHPPAGSVRIEQVWVDGKPWDEFDGEKLTVRCRKARRCGCGFGWCPPSRSSTGSKAARRRRLPRPQRVPPRHDPSGAPTSKTTPRRSGTKWFAPTPTGLSSCSPSWSPSPRRPSASSSSSGQGPADQGNSYHRRQRRCEAGVPPTIPSPEAQERG